MTKFLYNFQNLTIIVCSRFNRPFPEGRWYFSAYFLSFSTFLVHDPDSLVFFYPLVARPFVSFLLFSPYFLYSLSVSLTLFFGSFLTLLPYHFFFFFCLVQSLALIWFLLFFFCSVFCFSWYLFSFFFTLFTAFQCPIQGRRNQVYAGDLQVRGDVQLRPQRGPPPVRLLSLQGRQSQGGNRAGLWIRF